MNKLPVTAVVLTFNGELHLDRTLASLDFCRTLLVVDSGSTDRTLEIAAGRGARVLHRAWEGTIPQFHFAFTHVETPWIVTLDQDEILSPELRASLEAALTAPGDAAGFLCARRSFYFDRFIRHGGWYPDLLLRAFRADRVEIRGTLPHEEFHASGPVRRLEGDIIHYPYRDFGEHIRKIDSYTELGAKGLLARGKSPGLATALAHACGKFLRQYLLKLGFLDGRAGLILAVYAFFYSFNKYIRATEMRLREKSGPNA